MCLRSTASQIVQDNAGQSGFSALHLSAAETDAVLHAAQRLRLIQLRLTWIEIYQEVAAFVENNEQRMPRPARKQDSKGREHTLSRWCARQRERQRKPVNGMHPLTAEQQALLLALPGWQWGSPSPSARLPWDRWLQKLQEFEDEHHRRPSVKAAAGRPLEARERQLAAWCYTQRGKRRQVDGQPSLSPEQIAKLNALSYWSWGNDDAWWQSYVALYDFLDAQGSQRHWPRGSDRRNTTVVPPSEDKLNKWVKSQLRRPRPAQDGQQTAPTPPKKGASKKALTEDQVGALESLDGWVWEPMKDGWRQKRDELAAFMERHNGQHPKHNRDDSERSLYQWVNRERMKKRGSSKQTLTEEQTASLEAIPGFSWGWTPAPPT